MFHSIFGTNSKNKVTLKQVLIDFLSQNKFHTDTTDDENLIVLPLSGDNGNWKMIFYINEEAEILEIRSYCPIKIKDSQKIRIAELIARINNKLLLGCFPIDFEDGCIVYKTIHLAIETGLSLKTLEVLFRTNARTLDNYLPAITAVNGGYTEPVLAAF